MNIWCHLKQLVGHFRNGARDWVAESFSLRHKRLDCLKAAGDRDDAIMRGDREAAAMHEAERARLHREWEEMADSYERRWLV